MRRPGSAVPFYRASGDFIRYIPVREAYTLAQAGDADLTSKGTGRNYRITSCHMRPEANLQWKPISSAGFTVLQLVEV